MGPSRMLLGKPVIAAVEGYAVAGGLELALWCDLRVAARDAVFGVYCRRWGVPLIDGGTVRLPRLVGQSLALDMILTGRPVGAGGARDGARGSRGAEGTRTRRGRGAGSRDRALPQICAPDRLSAYEQWDLPYDAALANEYRRGLEALVAGESLAGATRFALGHGRGGASTTCEASERPRCSSSPSR
jgi:enoyl-CoA hydratase